VDVIPAIDLAGGRSRVVYWPGVAAGVGAPTDRPERIVAQFVGLGARVVHLVDMDGARAGAPANLEAVGRIAATVAVPIQIAGGLEAADHVRLAFAAGATRVVLAMQIVEEPERLSECLEVAGDWLAVGLDPRPERFAAFPWRRTVPPTLESLIGELAQRGVRRVILSHAGEAGGGAERLARFGREHDLDVLVAGGVSDLDGIRRLRQAGITGLILGEALLSGAIDYPAALEAAA
jgi:phosphoribosylformimino-5-aminoimidazole carboxamide ribotide isomerase